MPLILNAPPAGNSRRGRVNDQLWRIRRPTVDGRFVNRPYKCQALYGAWQSVRLIRHLLNRNYFQVWAGHVPQGRQPYLQRAQAEPSPERYQVLPAA